MAIVHLFNRTLTWHIVVLSAFFFMKATPWNVPLPQHVLRQGIRIAPLFSSSSDFERDEQVTGSIRSLCDFHEGQWTGTAKSFSVLPDVAAGIVQRKTSPEYKVSVKLGLDKNRDFSITETFEWDEKVSSRSLSLNQCNVDVDAVDASYSLDTTLPDFPSAISGTDKLCQFAIEHCIAASDNRRIRCFMLYGVDQSLQRLVVCNEDRIGPSTLTKEKDGPSTNQLTARDLMEMESDIDRLVNKITGNTDEISAVKDEQLNKETEMPDMSSLEKLGQSLSSTEGSQPLSSHDVSLLEVSSGVWLGDAIIRDMPGVAESPLGPGKGFASSAKSNPSTSSSFGTWNVGVQKMAWRWMWNFGDEIRQVVDVGKALGAGLSASMAKSLGGTVCVNESLSRRIPKEDRMVYIDWTGDIVGFLSSTVSIQVPRYLNFNKEASKKVAKPFFTEFSIYQSTKADETSDAKDETRLPELCCSRISRVYNYAGELRQGVTSFYTFKRFGVEEE